MQAMFTKHVWEVTGAKGKCLSNLVVGHSQTFSNQKMFFDKSESQVFRAAKNIVAFLKSPSPPSENGSLYKADHFPLQVRVGLSRHVGGQGPLYPFCRC